MWVANLFRGTKSHPFNILRNFHRENLNELIIFFILWIFNMSLSTYVQYFLAAMCFPSMEILAAKIGYFNLWKFWRPNSRSQNSS